MLLRLFVILIIAIGLIISTLALVLPREQLVLLIVFRDFFDMALPILGFGALIKYLCTKSQCCGCNCQCGAKG